MFMTHCWQVAAFAKDLSHALTPRTITGLPVVLYRTEAGEPVAMADQCPHRLVPLSLGRLDGDVVQCGYHGMRFGPDGACVSIPGQKMVPVTAKVRTYPVVEKHRFIWIWMGDAEPADPALVPDFHWMDRDDWAVAEGYHHVEANYRLLVDNLLDLSHETFVHPETIGNGAVAESPVAVSLINGKKTVRAHRDMLGAEPPPQFEALVGMTDKIDRWHTTLYTPPGFCVIEVGAVPAGSGDLSRGFEARILNLITPETERSSHYFWGHARNIRRDEPALTAVIRDSIVTTFDQDKHVLEAQQIACEREGTFDPGVAIAVDNAPLQGWRVLKRALEAQAA